MSICLKTYNAEGFPQFDYVMIRALDLQLLLIDFVLTYTVKQITHTMNNREYKY